MNFNKLIKSVLINVKTQRKLKEIKNTNKKNELNELIDKCDNQENMHLKTKNSYCLNYFNFDIQLLNRKQKVDYHKDLKEMIKILNAMILTMQIVIFNEFSLQLFFNQTAQNKFNQDEKYIFKSRITCLYCQLFIHIQ